MPQHRKRPAAAVKAQMDKLKIETLDNRVPAHRSVASLRGSRSGTLWLTGPDPAAVRKQAQADLEVCVQDVIRNRRRDKVRLAVIMEPLITFLEKQMYEGHMAVDVNGRGNPVRHGGVGFRRASIYGFEGPPEHKETLWLTFNVEYSDPDGDSDGGERDCEKEVSFEVPLSLANEFNHAEALAWVRAHNHALATKRLAEIEKRRVLLDAEREHWNRWERRNA